MDQINTFVAHSYDSMYGIQIFSMWAEWVSAFGAILVAVIAIWGNEIRMKLFKPKLNIILKNKKPHVSLDKIESSTSDSKKIVKIKIEFNNLKKIMAQNCQARAESIYTCRDDNKFYLVEEFPPANFYWASSKLTENIIHNIPTYLDFAEIKEEERATEQDEAESSNLEKIMQIQCELKNSTFLKVGKGKNVIPILVTYDGCNTPIKKFVMIFWDGNSFSDQLTPRQFFISELDEKSFKEQIVGE